MANVTRLPTASLLRAVAVGVQPGDAALCSVNASGLGLAPQTSPKLVNTTTSNQGRLGDFCFGRSPVACRRGVGALGERRSGETFASPSIGVC
jgi:hypothetical protein